MIERIKIPEHILSGGYYGETAEGLNDRISWYDGWTCVERNEEEDYIILERDQPGELQHV